MKNRNSRSNSVWQHINPLIADALKDIESWVAKSGASKFILCHFRIENIAAILYSYGHDFSIGAIKKIPDYISANVQSRNKVIRVGIEDIIMIAEIENSNEAIKLIESSLRDLRSFGSEEQLKPMFMKFKVGATHLGKSSDLQVKLDETFIALYESASSPNSPYIIFDNLSKKLEDFKSSMQKAAEFQKILQDKSIRLAYQPVIDSKTGKVKSYEVLMRVVQENGELISAGSYIQIAEYFGFIDQVDLLVLELAIKEVRDDSKVSLGINVSAMSIANDKWLDSARHLLQDPDVASRIIIEITETGFINNMDRMQYFVDEIQSLGCQVAIDDFGAGYTSFTQLKSLRADILKIDGVFIKDIATNYDNQLFVKTLVSFAKAFGLKTVAEFVENGEVAKLLIDIGIDYLQGHYFGKAVNYRPWINEDNVA